METGEWAYGAGEVADRLKDTAIGSALAFSALNVPGAISSVGNNLSAGGTGGNAAVQDGSTILEEKSSSQLDASDGIIAEVRDSMKEGGLYGEERRETREAFSRRIVGEGYAVQIAGVEGEGRAAAYGYRDVYPKGCTGEVRRGLNEFGIPSFAMDGTLWQNQNGLSRLLTVSDAAAVPGVGVFVNAETTIPPVRIVGHEAFMEIVEGGIN